MTRVPEHWSLSDLEPSLESDPNPWPARTHLCQHCRSALVEDAACDCQSPALLPFGDRAARRALTHHVWGEGARPEHMPRGPQTKRPPALAWLAAITAMVLMLAGWIMGSVWLMLGSGATIMSFPLALYLTEDKLMNGQRRLAWPTGFTPLGGSRPQPRLLGSGAGAITGVIDPSATRPSPLAGVACVAFALELRNDAADGSPLMLRDSATLGFSVTTDAGERVLIPAGAIEIMGPLAVADGFRARLHLARIEPIQESAAGPDPFPFEQALEVTLAPGARVRLHNPVHLTLAPPTLLSPGLSSGLSSGRAAGEHYHHDNHYRESAGTALMPKGVPRIEPLPVSAPDAVAADLTPLSTP